MSSQKQIETPMTASLATPRDENARTKRFCRTIPPWYKSHRISARRTVFGGKPILLRGSVVLCGFAGNIQDPILTTPSSENARAKRFCRTVPPSYKSHRISDQRIITGPSRAGRTRPARCLTRQSPPPRGPHRRRRQAHPAVRLREPRRGPFILTAAVQAPERTVDQCGLPRNRADPSSGFGRPAVAQRWPPPCHRPALC